MRKTTFQRATIYQSLLFQLVRTQACTLSILQVWYGFFSGPLQEFEIHSDLQGNTEDKSHLTICKTNKARSRNEVKQ